VYGEGFVFMHVSIRRYSAHCEKMGFVFLCDTVLLRKKLEERGRIDIKERPKYLYISFRQDRHVSIRTNGLWLTCVFAYQNVSMYYVDILS
jgi:hypothetical protein